MKLIEVCKVCGKQAKLLITLKDVDLFQCGHKREKDAPPEMKESNEFDFDNLSGSKSAYEYQKTGIQFSQISDYNCLIADAMGLGKTIQALLALKNSPDKLLPALVLVPANVLYNWTKETWDWLTKDPMGMYVIQGKMPLIPRGFKVYICSTDSLSRNMEKSIKYEKGVDYQIKGQIFELGIKSLIVDECHKFKDDSALRTRALITFVKGANIKHKILLSGTPIKNRADEYFVALNLLNPVKFPSRDQFRRQYLEKDEKGRWANLNRYRIDRFQEATKNFIIRREKTQVLKNLPSFARLKSFITIEDPEIKNTYNRQLKMFQFKMDTEKLNSISILGEMAKLRRITGMSKIKPAIEWAEEWFEDADLEKSIDASYPDKLAIGIHHIGVKDNLKLAFDYHDKMLGQAHLPESMRDKLLKIHDVVDEQKELKISTEIKLDEPEYEKPFRTLTLSGEDSSWNKQQIVERFFEPQHRILVISELAGGIGLNLQACANTLVLERQWNAADEEQFESRFHRDGQTYPVTATYMMASGTIDEFFDELVEDKRRIFGNTIDRFRFTEDSDSIKQLAERTLANPLK